MHSLFDHEKLEAFRKEHKLQPYRIRQLQNAVFKNHIIDFDEMTNLGKDLRSDLKKEFEIIPFGVKTIKEDDETTKFLFESKDGQVFEAVLMYHKHTDPQTKIEKLNRITLCISSQVWCSVGCIFCVTGKLGLKKNMNRDEILGQVIYANNYIKNKFGKKEDWSRWTVRNIVFMGMGEPLMNYDQIKVTFPFLTSTDYYGLSSKRVTVSTSGIYPGLEAFIKDNPPVSLAFSIHAPNQELREHLVPMGKFYKLDRLMELMDEYVETSGNKVFYEYVMINNENDMPEIAHQTGKLLQNRYAHLNLIPYNQNPAIQLEESTPAAIKKFKDIVESYNVTVTVRQNMGRKEKSACGQLGYDALKESLKKKLETAKAGTEA